MRHTLAFCSLGLILVGCGGPVAPSLKSVPAAALPAGYTLQNAEKYGISIGVPGGWKVGSGEAHQSMADMAAQMGSDPNAAPDPSQMGGELGKMMKEQEAKAKEEEKAALAALEAKGIIIRVNNVTVRPVFGEDPTRFQVKIMPNPAASLEDAATTVMEHAPGEEKPQPVTLPAGPAMVIRADKKMRDGGEVVTSKYVLQDGKTLIVVSFVTEADPSIIRSIEKPVMDSLRVVPGKAVPPVPKDS